MKRPNLSVYLHILFTSGKLAVFRLNMALGAGIKKPGQQLNAVFAHIVTILFTLQKIAVLSNVGGGSRCPRNIGLSTTNCANSRMQCTEFDFRVYLQGDTDDTLGAFVKKKNAKSY